jgi:tripartite-type tricarboxylate transporter receptor subunit TctC
MKLPHRRQFLHLAAGATALPTVSRLARAQTYPARPVRIIVPFTPAGAPDIVARLMGQWLSERLGRAFVIENRPSASSNLGTEAVVRAPPDGYTLLWANSANAIVRRQRSLDRTGGLNKGEFLAHRNVRRSEDETAISIIKRTG